MTRVNGMSCHAWRIAIFVLAMAAAGCDRRSGEPAAAIPPTTVLVTTVTREPIDFEFDLPGRIEPQRTAEIRARVDGIVERLLYTEGTDVAAGTPLFQIDASDYKAQLAQAEAMLQRAQAVQKNAASVAQRFRPLVSRQAVSAQEYEAALAALGQAQANVADARATVTLATLRLERCTVRAPIAGRVGRALVTEGALVSAAQATLLAQINQISPISATFTKSSTAILDLAEYVRSGALTTPEDGKFSVRITLPNGREYAERGVVDFADLVVDRTSGAQTVRAQFENADRALLPGQFVRGRFHIGVRHDGALVPARAVQLNNGIASVLVVGADDIVQPRQIEIGEQQEGNWVVRQGLDSGDRVVVDGWHKVRPGQRVTPSEDSTGR
ncbi:efflux RND transporter periplasmic adaptor subunit [Bordetella sp. BOR01]|uniref:efflux RND transporter periplasmic adaptor subunit n=1 Tax=Bordetella sp. BOR01 TaxID=2854779 RepID=UPI001C46366E|nr:efflux RND transporter periplasmic adaptor subunit [Bordetella sp. BOR01]MBV7486071.1 efflux RND transporter periplasmic adaptor subunit [Bordetella sp. BOR01]